MIKKCAVVGALGMVFGGVCLSEMDISKSKGTNNEIQQKDNFSHEKAFDLTGYVVGIHKSSDIIEVANVETKEAAIEFSEKRYNFINLAVEDKFVLFKNEDNQKYEIGEKIKLSADKIDRINHLIKILIEPNVTKITAEK